MLAVLPDIFSIYVHVQVEVCVLGLILLQLMLLMLMLVRCWVLILVTALFSTVNILFIFFINVSQTRRFTAMTCYLILVVHSEFIEMQRRYVLFLTMSYLLDLLLLLVLEY